ncbi:hypothetical protein Peur_068545 [Populus x canadensis]
MGIIKLKPGSICTLGVGSLCCGWITMLGLGCPRIKPRLSSRINSVKLIYLDFDQFIVTGSSELEKPLLIALSGEKEVV